MDKDEGRVTTARQREATRIANRPSRRQRMLVSTRAERIAGRPDLQYRGEGLGRPR